MTGDINLGRLEALLFASPRALSTRILAKRLELSEKQVTGLIDRVAERLESPERGLQLRETHGGWRLETKPLHAALVSSIRAERGERALSSQALEALAVVALRQPVATEEVSAIRALDSGATLETLRKRKLIVKERSRGAGERAAWKTTENFLDLFGLGSLEELFRENAVERIFRGVIGGATVTGCRIPDDRPPFD